MERVLRDFIFALRNAGIRVSVSESLDAAHTLDLVGYEDRDTLKISLAAALAKTPHEKDIFKECFDRFFSFTDYSENVYDSDIDFEAESDDILAPLTTLLISGDQADIMTSLIQAVSKIQLSNMQFFTQKNPYSRRILSTMGIEGLDRDIRRLDETGMPGAMQQAEALRDARGRLFDYIRSYVNRYYDLFTHETRATIIERQLKDMKLSAVEERDFLHMLIIVKKMVKRLNDIHSRRRKSFRRGQLDFKKTMRKNITYQGPLFNIVWKKQKIDRPSLVVICDVSRSVRMIVRFFLLFLYSLNEVIGKIRSFIFCNNLIDVSHIFDDYPVEKAVEILRTGKGLDIGLSRTNYGEAFINFHDQHMGNVDKKTTVIILGDGRNNYFDSETALLRKIQEKSKRLIWLNPESVPFWGSGDSEMKRYGPLCDVVRECNTLRHLERIIDDIL
jgi:uncharacterized protein with von Willebrand factor type A (vWA) domain